MSRAEILGYHSLWVQEQILGMAPSLDPISLLCYVAAITETIRLGTAVVIATTRNPVILAKQFSTLDQMSEIRRISGGSLGGTRMKYPLFGSPKVRIGLHLVESIRAIKEFWEREYANFNGYFWRLDGESMQPKPIQKPPPTDLVWWPSPQRSWTCRTLR